MACVKIVSRLKGSFCHLLLVIALWLSSYQNVVALPLLPKPGQTPSTSELPSSPNSATFQPIDISPTMIPHYPFSGEPLPPMYPSFPKTYDPVLTGRCPVNFSVISSITGKTASDCTQSLSTIVGNVICCPQFNSLLHIFQGFYSNHSDTLVLQNVVAGDCFKDIISILASRGANSSLSSLCSVKSSNLTGGSCPIKDISTFEKAVNTSKLLESCSTVDPLKECCRPVCQPAISEAALQISGIKMTLSDNKNIVGAPSEVDTLNDCKGVVYSWIARKLRFEDANTAFRLLSSCKVNKGCQDLKRQIHPKSILSLDFKQPVEVINACRNLAAPSPSCCSSLNAYITGIQKQMLITNRQAIICAAVFGYMLQKAGVMTNVYELCDIDLKDFSLQAYGQEEGCLLRSLPADLVYDNSSGFSFTCDLNDNIAAPWPSSSSVTSLSLCAPEMSLPALPTSQTLGNSGCHLGGVHFLLSTILVFVSTLLY